jgi:putative oxidoreductase
MNGYQTNMKGKGTGIKLPGNVAATIIQALLILLFIYTATSKLINFDQFKGEMYNQTLPHEVATVLIWTLPGIEILAAMLLLFERTQPVGYYLSALLLSLFTGYVSLVLLNFFSRVPCSCGGVIKALGWKMHLIFNLFFLLLSILGIFITNRERRLPGKKI